MKNIIDIDQFTIESSSTSDTIDALRTVFPTNLIYRSKIGAFTDETALKSLLITKNPNICQGKPTIQGTRISVSYIVELYYVLEWGFRKILDEYRNLTKEQINAALEYYENHQKEIDSYLHKEKEVSPLNEST